LRALASNKFFYCANANGGKSLDNTVTSHRWSTDDNQNGHTLFVSKKNSQDSCKTETFNGWLFTPVQIKGASNSANILAACQASKLQTPCDHPNYIQSDIFFESKGAWKVRVPVRLNAISNGAVGP
jgi:hypothetical protein